MGLLKKNPKVLKPAFTIPPKLLQSLVEDPKWDEKGSVTQNYNSFGVVNDPNSLTDSLRAPPSVSDDPNDSGSDLEEDGIFVYFSIRNCLYFFEMHVNFMNFVV